MANTPETPNKIINDVFNAWPDVQSDILRHPYDFSIDYVKLYPWNGGEPIDITNIRGQINIYEDIFNSCLTGSIQLIDAWDIPVLYPLIGEEILEISWKRPGTKEGNNTTTQPSPTDLLNNFPKDLQKAVEVKPSTIWKMKFRIVKMTDRILQRDKTQSYTLHFISPEAIQNKKKKVSKGYKKKLYSDIVKDIFDSYIKVNKTIECEKTKYEQDFCVAHWTPAQAINIIASRSIPAKNNGSTYVFYESLKNFHFVSLETLFQQEPKETILYQWKNVWLNVLNRDINDEVRSVDEYDFVEYFDVLSNLQHGMYAAKLLTYDLVRQRSFEHIFDYIKEFDNHKHLEKNKLCSDKLDALGEPYEARFDLMSTNKDHDTLPWITGREPGIKPTRIEDYVLPRQSQFQQINNVRVAITLPGNTDRKVGDIISFALPNAMAAPEYWHEAEKYVSGRYLIAAIRHRLEKNGYVNDIELIKDSFFKQIEYVDPVPIYEKLGLK